MPDSVLQGFMFPRLKVAIAGELAAITTLTYYHFFMPWPLKFRGSDRFNVKCVLIWKSRFTPISNGVNRKEVSSTVKLVACI